MLADRAAAEDVTQEVFLTAWRRLPEIHAEAAFSGWLYRVATNRCLNHKRSTHRLEELDAEATPGATSAGQPERAVETAAQVDALTAALARLGPDVRACWLLREVHGRTYEEIASTIGVPVATVRGRISRARAKLAEAMQAWR